jgi:hypothetical protein
VKLNLAKRFTRDGNQWTWEFKDFEPTLADDLQIVAHPKRVEFGRPLPGAVAKSQSEAPEYADFVNINERWSLHHRDYEATASSTLPASGENTYDVANLKDLNSESAWVEGAKGDGIGEKLELTLRTPRKLAAIALRNGYCKSESTYRNNARIAELAISVNGAAPFTAAIPDERLEHHDYEIPSPPTPAKSKPSPSPFKKPTPAPNTRTPPSANSPSSPPSKESPKSPPPAKCQSTRSANPVAQLS